MRMQFSFQVQLTPNVLLYMMGRSLASTTTTTTTKKKKKKRSRSATQGFQDKFPGLILPHARFGDSKILNPNDPGPSKD